MSHPSREELDAFWESDTCRSVFPIDYSYDTYTDIAEGWYPELEDEDDESRR